MAKQKKISDLRQAQVADVKPGAAARVSVTGVILPVVEDDETKYIDVDDLFKIASEITASGNVSSSGTISGNIVSASQGLYATDINLGSSITASGDISASGDLISSTLIVTDITASGNISASGTVFADGFESATKGESIDFNDNIDVQGNLTVTGSTDLQGNLTASGEVTASKFSGESLDIDGGTSTINVSDFTIGTDTGDRVNFNSIIASGIKIAGALSGSIISASGDLFAHDITANSGSFEYITASLIDVNAETIRIGGTPFSKTELDKLKAGKSISTNTTKTILHAGDDGTYVGMKPTAQGRVIHVVSNKNLLDMTTSSFAIGDITVPVKIKSSNFDITGSTEFTGSTTISGSFDQSGSFNSNGSSSFSGSVETSGSNVVSGSFDTSGSFNSNGSSSFSGSVETSGSNTITGSLGVTGSATFNCGDGGFGVNNLLDLLENFGNTGIPTGSDGFGNDLPGGGVGAGDINLDGQVNISDLLLLLSGYGNPSTLCSNVTVPPNTNSQLVGPEITISSSITVTVSEGGSLRIF